MGLFVFSKAFCSYTSFLEVMLDRLCFADPREMQDSDEFLRLLLDFLDAELRAVATGVPLQKALMMQAMPKKLKSWPSRRISYGSGVVIEADRLDANDQQTSQGASVSQGGATHQFADVRGPSTCGNSIDEEPPGVADLPTLFSVFFEGVDFPFHWSPEMDGVRL